MQAVTSEAVFNTCKKWTDITSAVTFTLTNVSSNCSWYVTPKAWICGSEVHFHIHIKANTSAVAGTNLCTVKISSSLFTTPFYLSRIFSVSYYGDSVNTSGLNVYEEEADGIITFRKGAGTQDGTVPAGFDMTFNATVPVLLS